MTSIRGATPTAGLRDRCADLADRRDDSMLGTAFPAPRLLLVEQPGPWGRAGLLESRFDRAVARQLVGRLDRAGVRVVAIRRPGRNASNGLRRWAMVRCIPGREAIGWGRFAADADLLEIDPDGILAPPPSGAPVFLVCAHGSHDVCCALRGRPVAAALEAARPGQVWECSHVGGDRFAANVLVLPVGLMYGRVPADAAETLASAADGGRVVGELLRGRVGFSPAAQAAIALLHREVPRLAAAQVLSAEVTAADGDTSTVRIVTAVGVAQALVRVEAGRPEWLTCHAAQPGTVPAYRPESLHWQDVRVVDDR